MNDEYRATIARLPVAWTTAMIRALALTKKFGGDFSSFFTSFFFIVASLLGCFQSHLGFVP